MINAIIGIGIGYFAARTCTTVMHTAIDRSNHMPLPKAMGCVALGSTISIAICLGATAAAPVSAIAGGVMLIRDLTWLNRTFRNRRIKA